jgi:PTH1 family peptidyl-tRNA hydrolase
VKLLVGLGNPGREYRETRHNVGFKVVEEIARRHHLEFALAPSQVPDAFVVKKFGPDAYLLAKPLTSMNRSGDAVAALARYYDIAAADLLIVYDDIDLGTTDFPRLRLGVGRGDKRRDLADHVLSKFEPEEQAGLDAFITRAADAAEMFAADDILTVMNTYNAEPADSAESN